LPFAIYVEQDYFDLICLMSRTPGSDEVIDHGRDGFLIEPSKEGGLAGLEEALAMTVPQREGMDLCAREKIIEQYELRKAVQSAFDKLGIGAQQPHARHSTAKEQS
jgi:hypothetical protein